MASGEGYNLDQLVNLGLVQCLHYSDTQNVNAVSFGFIQNVSN